VLWRGAALRRYRHKLTTDAGFHRWWEEAGRARVAEHWAHNVVEDDFDNAHLASQLYELGGALWRRLGQLGDARVLDAGASDGFFLARIGARHGIGVNFLEVCARKISADGFDGVAGDIERLPFRDKAFDHVICSQTLEHVPNPIHTLTELARVCAGRLFISIPWLPRTRISARAASWPEVEEHIFEFSAVDFLKILTHAGLRVVHQELVPVFPEPRNPLSQWWFSVWMYPSYFPKLQFYELERG
jgi:SAM-dependent methyltransferase